MLGLQSVLFMHRQAIEQACRSFIKKPLATGMTILVIGLTLTLPALFWMFSKAMSEYAVQGKKSSHLSLYLSRTLKPDAQAALLNRIRQTPGVELAELKSPEMGLKELEGLDGMRDMMHYLPENPLPPMVDVTPLLSINEVDVLKALHHRLLGYEGVELAKLDLEWLNRFYSLLHFAGQLATALMVLLGVAVIFIIGHTLRLVIQHRQEEIQVLKLIGATPAYIMRPFLYLGTLYGGLGALVACGMVNGLLISLSGGLSELVSVYELPAVFLHFSWFPGLLLLVFAMGLGWIGAFWSLNRQLRFIEPLT